MISVPARVGHCQSPRGHRPGVKRIVLRSHRNVEDSLVKVKFIAGVLFALYNWVVTQAAEMRT